MNKFTKKTGKVIGAAPGTLIHIGENINKRARITLFEYDENYFEDRELQSIEECFKTDRESTIKWVNIDAIDKVEIIERIGKEFNLHPLMLEDILSTGQRPKLDDYDDYILIVLKMLYYNEETSDVEAEQVSFVLKDNYIFSFQEFEGDVFENVRERLRNGKRNIRKTGPDYLVYALIDAIVDSYFIILEKIGDKTEDIEQKLMEDPGKEVLHSIYKLKREMIYLRNSIWPLREVVNSLVRCDTPLFNKSTVVYLRDVYDHIIQVIDTVETYRDVLSGMLDTYLSSISNKTNDVMKVLTIFSTIFIPLTFVAGIYGMNFKYIPELEFQWGYGFFWMICSIIIFMMFRYFKRKKWF